MICDNLKAAVTNPDRYDPGLNRTYAEMASHYGTAVLAARPRRPKDKAKVEVAVQIAQRWVLARLRNQRFFSLAELNAAIRVLVAELNARQMRGFGSSRAELFAEIDRPKLGELPDQPYVFARWKRCRIAPDYHVEVDGHCHALPPDPRARRCAHRRQDRRDLPQGSADRQPRPCAQPARPIRQLPITCRARIAATASGRQED